MQYTKATVTALILSDVPGDDLSVIASGLTVPDTTTFKDAWQIIEKYRLSEKLPDAIRNHLTRGATGIIPDTPKAGNPVFSKVHNALVATNKTAMEAAAKKAQALGYATLILSPALSGEVETQANKFVQYLRDNKYNSSSCFLWGGEPTVTIKGKGKGGRNQHFALAALCALENDEWAKHTNVTILSGGTDGTDGPTDAAGAVADAAIIAKMNELSIDPEVYLHHNDAYHFFEKTGGLMITGATQTNVMDIVVGLVNKK